MSTSEEAEVRTKAASDDDDKSRTDGPQAEAPMSKNQLKKRRRWERMMEVKKRRKEQEKQVKLEKAKKEGRDLEAERRELAARTAAGDGKRRRQAFWEQKLSKAASSFQVAIDCAFESSMSDKEINSLALQIRHCYAANRKSPSPCLMAATSLSGKTLQHLQNVSGFEEWSTRAFDCTSKSVQELYQSRISDVVYLTSDSSNILDELDDTKIYVIGGIVDRNRLRYAALNRAKDLGVATAKLPLEKHLQKMEATRVLTCNHVFEVLIKYKQYKDWGQALLAVLPQRKGAKPSNESQEQMADDKDTKL